MNWMRGELIDRFPWQRETVRAMDVGRRKKHAETQGDPSEENNVEEDNMEDKR